MSERMSGRNGKHPRRTPQEAPGRPPGPFFAPEADGSASGGEDRPAGLLGAQGDSPSIPALDGRGANGKFLPGNTLGRGHVVNRKISELRRAALATETPEQVAAVIGKMRDLAMEGDTTAARIYIETMIGKPVQGVEISGPDGSPLERSAEISAALGAALSPFSDEVRFAVLGVIRKAIHAGGTE